WVSDIVSNEQRGIVSGYFMAANLGGGALGATVTLTLASRFSAEIVASITAILTFIPSLFVLPFPSRTSRSDVSRSHRHIRSDIRMAIQSKSFLTGFILFLSPASCVAALNLFSGL